MGKLVAIHQPNFFPWLGYFNKIVRANVFVFMDDVSFPKTGRGNWTNRVRIIVQNKETWITCPVVRDHGTQMIREVRIDERQPWRKKLLKTIQHNYGRAPFFEENWEWIQSLVGYETESISDFNIHTIENICSRLCLAVNFVRQSSLGTVYHATDLLIEITRAVSGDSYLCGGGAGGYQEDEKFDKSSIILCYQNYIHPIYAQQGIKTFIPGMSVLDALFQIGLKQTKNLLMQDVVHGYS